MADTRADDLSTPFTVELERGEPISAYVVKLADGSVVGRTDFVDSPGEESARIFFHTEVDPEFGGRGLARRLIRAALDDSIRDGIAIVPVCPLFARHLDRQGDEFLAAGGRFRAPVRADSVVIGRIVTGHA